MPTKPTKSTSRRDRVREQKARTARAFWVGLFGRLVSWPVVVGVLFVALASVVALLGEETLPYSIGERIDEPIYARVKFEVPDPKRTSENRETAAAQAPSYYQDVSSAVAKTVRADLMRLYDVAAAADTIEKYGEALKELNWPAEPEAHKRLRELVNQPEERGRERFREWVDDLPIENEYVVRDWPGEPRSPKSTREYILLLPAGDDAKAEPKQVANRHLVSQGNEKALRGSAGAVAKKLSAYELRSTVEAVVLEAFRKQPTIVFDRERTEEQMNAAREATPEVVTVYEKGKPIVDSYSAGADARLTAAQYELLERHRDTYLNFLDTDLPEAEAERKARLLQHVGMVGVIALLSIAMFVYTGLHHRRVFEVPSRTMAFVVLMLGMLLAARLLCMRWPGLPELVLTPCLMAGSVLVIAYPRRFAWGVTCIAAVLVTATVRGDLLYLLTLLTGLVVTVYQLEEIRTRTKIIGSGVVTAVAVAVVSAAGGLLDRQAVDFVLYHAAAAAACALLASFLISGVLPFVERMFGIATSLTLLEWTDSRNPLLQLLAREAPGTYNHSLVLGTLARAACERIGSNGLLVQVGALYHDIGKIHKAQYFTENQEGQISRHDNLAPTMSLLIILAHVKDGIEMAKEYKLPRVLHQFINEHHGTTVVRFFHHMASEKQPTIASGKHDREVPEAEFRYAGPKPRSPETAVLMLADSVEGAVRSLNEPTAGRIESAVHQLVMARLDDGQFDNCDITLRQIRQVEDSLVKSLCSIYHGRVAYPKARKADAPGPEQEDHEPGERRVRPAAG